MENVKVDDMEKIIIKIRKILELSRNNPSENEAKAALLKAQRMMMEYHIEMCDIDSNGKDDLSECELFVGNGNKWKYLLAGVIAKNFRCKHYLYGTDTIVFYGYETDAKIAMETFKFLFEHGNKEATRHYNRKRKESMTRNGYFNGAGIKNNFLIGYVSGIKEILEKQCTALMIVIPKEVESGFEDLTKDFRKSRHSYRTRNDEIAREEGRKSGRSAVSSRKLEG